VYAIAAIDFCTGKGARLRVNRIWLALSVGTYRLQATFPVGIADGIGGTAPLDFPLHQRVTMPGDYRAGVSLAFRDLSVSIAPGVISASRFSVSCCDQGSYQVGSHGLRASAGGDSGKIWWKPARGFIDRVKAYVAFSRVPPAVHGVLRCPGIWPNGHKTRHLIAPNARSKAAIRSQVTCASAVANFRSAETVGTVNTRA